MLFIFIFIIVFYQSIARRKSFPQAFWIRLTVDICLHFYSTIYKYKLNSHTPLSDDKHFIKKFYLYLQCVLQQTRRQVQILLSDIFKITTTLKIVRPVIL